MERNWIGELKNLKELNIKPNFSDLSRKYGIDRHRLKTCYELGRVPERTKRTFKSVWDRYYDEIIELMSIEGTSKIAAYRYLEAKYEELPGTYNGFRSYTLRKNIAVKKSHQAHVLYETAPGEQLQFDWKENLKIKLSTEEVIEFNVFSATLGYSRNHVFIFSYHKTTDDLIRCLIETFKRLGGTTEKVFTDNMAAIVSLKGPNKKVHPRIKHFMNDLGVKLELAKVRTPETKGKVENSNKFINWLRPYEGKLKNIEELIHTIEVVIQRQSNQQVNQGTKVAPIILFGKEKEYLKPIGNQNLLDRYIEEHYREKVPTTLLVRCRGLKYSVPPKYIGSYVDIYPVAEEVYIYHNKVLIATHTITQNKINYDENHYKESISARIINKEIDIDEVAKKNLERLSKLGGAQ